VLAVAPIQHRAMPLYELDLRSVGK
jgi:hypothetical protein